MTAKSLTAQPEAQPVPAETRALAQDFLYREARMIDTEQHREWLTRMVDPDIRYQVFSRQLRSRKDNRFAGPRDVYLYDDNLDILDRRIKQLETGLHWRIDPPERIRHMITNIEVYAGEEPDTLLVHSNCIVVRNRRVYEESMFVYGREDTLRFDAEGRLRLLRRLVDYDQRFIPGRNLMFIL